MTIRRALLAATLMVLLLPAAMGADEEWEEIPVPPNPVLYHYRYGELSLPDDFGALSRPLGHYAGFGRSAVGSRAQKRRPVGTLLSCPQIGQILVFGRHLWERMAQTSDSNQNL